ncbi:MAG: hypothetical protein E2590_11700 [Chryseobacterium sp.]|nr:hypothetical protein [Chryseobacterium sp.]
MDYLKHTFFWSGIWLTKYLEHNIIKFLTLFFETQSKQLDNIVNNIAERIRSLGQYVSATLQSYLRSTHFTEQNGEKHNNQTFIIELLQDHESLILILCEHTMSCKDDLHDVATSHFITRLLEIHQKMAWLLRSYIIE